MCLLRSLGLNDGSVYANMGHCYYARDEYERAIVSCVIRLLVLIGDSDETCSMRSCAGVECGNEDGKHRG